MKLGFLTSGAVEDVRFASQHHFGCVELALFGETPLFNEHRAFRAALEDEGVELAAVSLFGRNHLDPDPSRRQEHLDLWERSADLAAALGAPVFVTGSGQVPGAEEEQWGRVVEELGGRIQGVQRRGLKFAFYNCHWENVVDRPAAWERVLPGLPGAGIKFDPSHPVYAGRDWRPELLAAGARLFHVHARDVLEVGGQRLPDPNPGLGQISWGAFFGILYHIGFEGAICIEPHSALYTGERRYPFLVLSEFHLSQFLLPELE